MVSVAGCKKKMAPLTPTAAAPAVVAPAPTAQITASPTAITVGDPVVIKWTSTNANSASIDGLGEVPTQGVKTLTPSESTTYHLVVKGDGGKTDASVRVTVNRPPVVAAPSSSMTIEEMEAAFKTKVHDIFFDYDKYTVRSDGRDVLAQDAKYLLANPTTKILIGGYCDERGSNEYNLALGQKRADSAKKALTDAGVDASRIRVISYGKEKPFCSESTAACWQQNRRAGFSLDR
jgi:peptidoglycan-associated lipoprotein